MIANPISAARLDETRKFVEQFVAARGQFFKDEETPSNAEVEAIILLLTSRTMRVWEEAVSVLDAEIAAGAVDPVKVELRFGELLTGRLSGEWLVDVVAAVESIYATAFTMLELWKPAGKGSAPHRLSAEALRLSPNPLRNISEIAVALASLRGTLAKAVGAAFARAAGNVGILTGTVQAFSEELSLAISVGDSNAVEVGVDAWAYGVFAAATVAQSPPGDFVLWNPLDSRTSPFCRWASGRTISAETMRKAILPARRADPANSTAFVPRDGKKTIDTLPPYHPRCRTYVVPAAYYAEFRPRTA